VVGITIRELVGMVKGGITMLEGSINPLSNIRECLKYYKPKDTN
jgi:hypothetical protein